MNNRQSPNASAGWFQGAPLTKFVCLSVILGHVLLEKGGFSGGTDLIALDLEDLVERCELYRLLLYPMTFKSVSELMVGIAVMGPLLRRFEREMGSRKFASFLFLKIFIPSTILQCFLLMLSDGYLAPGPYPYIGALLYLYNTYTPRLYPKFIGILGWDFSEKAITYFFTLQLITSDGWSSLVPTMCGYLCSAIASSPATPFGSYDPKFPAFVYHMSDSIGRSIGLSDLLAPPPTIVRGMRAAGRQGRGGRGGNAQRLVPGPPNPFGIPPPAATAAAPPRPPQYQPLPQADPPSEDAINQLTMMGFDREAVIRALRATDNNLEAAANRLLTS